MDRSNHTMACLFAQLGLVNTQSDIESFINTHKGISADKSLASAGFWTESQQHFINEAIAEDSDWSEIVDSLDCLLR